MVRGVPRFKTRSYVQGSMSETDHNATRQFAISVVRDLRQAGFEALWAGGCVRDQLMGIQPKDYDVATDATPPQVRQLFGHGRTLSIGAAFGVITVLGPRDAEPVEVATFRHDAPYSDGRHPDSVRFSTAEEDALRRDFTINGMFYDPQTERIIDYVDGQRDIRLRVVRAIRDPRQRIAEDKLRMLRAVRFAAQFDFEIEPETFLAVQEQAHEIVIVSAERVAAELRRMLVQKNRVRAVELLRETGLLEVVLPESLRTTNPAENVPEAAAMLPWRRTLHVLGRLRDPSFPMALAGLLLEITDHQADQGRDANRICRRWRLSRQEISTTIRLLTNHDSLRSADQMPWPRLQRMLVSDGIEELLQFAEAVADVDACDPRPLQFCREQLALPAEELNPKPLIGGEDLIRIGVPRGPHYRVLLDQVRDAQLLGQIRTLDEAMQLVPQILSQLETSES